MKIVITVFSLALLAVGASADGQIRFARVERSEDRDVRHVYKRQNVHWHAAAPSMQRLILVGQNEVNITLHCRVERLDERDVLRYVDFCFSTRNRFVLPRWCDTVHAGKTRKRLKIGKGQLAVDLSFDPHTGGEARLSRLSPDMSVDDIAAECDVANRHGHRTSSPVEFFDYRNQFPKTVFESDQPMTFATEKSNQLQCLKKAPVLDKSITLSFTWTFCDKCRQGPSQLCNCESILTLASGWPVQVLRDGSLYWPNITENVRPRLQGKFLRCSLADQTLTIYQNPLHFQSVTSNASPSLLKPTPASEDIELFDSSSTSVTLPFIVEGQELDWEWRREGQPLKSEDAPQRGCSLNRGRLVQCRGPFTDGDEGRYTVDVTSASRRQKRSPDSSSHVNGSYSVRTVGYPLKAPDMPSEIYVADGSSAEVTCRFQRPDLVSTSMAIRGETVNFQSFGTLRKSMDEINRDYKDVMAPLHGSFNRERPRSGEVVTYTAHKMVYRSPKHGNLSSSHYVECIGYRGDYDVRFPVFLKVTPRPELEDTASPAASNYSECEQQVVDCKVSNMADFRAERVSVAIQWTVGDRSIDDLDKETKRYFQTSSDGSRLTIGPVSEPAVGRRLRGETVVCVISLRQPSYSSSSRKAFYSSTTDASLRERLSTTVRVSTTGRVPWLEQQERRRRDVERKVGLGLGLGLGLLAAAAIVVAVLVIFCARRVRSSDTSRQSEEQELDVVNSEPLIEDKTPCEV